ncbi:tetratricopeptide repeat protein [Pseudodesulfovibrio portus]|uniref:Sel1 repeat family protein n=1 Tax=Pseudodesulfovibrio portus TaxID=231439 RepID=A0ABM8ASX6_9BACT|nr:tetratricopeptide repeat protein [Pseudodesulfovibrio portus]BDQ34526.1 hypothetical protein JCM14722_20680 [Pseudodesulfovibrio portus]
MIFRYLAAILVPALLLLGVYCTALPELGHEIKAAARGGDAAAQVELARMYYSGDTFEPDMTESLRWLNAAADQKYPEALSTLGLFYLSGHGVEKDEARGFAMITEAAELGYPQAQAYLAFAYGSGTGVKPDTAKFLHWVRLAAENNDPRSQFNLAVLKLTGKLVDQDVPGARALLESSADQGYTEAQTMLGEFLARGIQGEPDLVEACKWFAIAGTKGHQRANSLLMSIVNSMTKDQMNEAADRANAWLEARGQGVR